jgi:LacI family transcriptional regulator
MSKPKATTKVSIHDVAKRVGYSTTVVSHALNGYARINKDTRERIQRIAAKMGYRPNIFGRSLATQRSRLIGVVVPGIVTSFYPETILPLKMRLQAADYGLLMMTSDDTRRGECDAIEFLRQRQVDGLVVSPAKGSKDASLYEELTRAGTPVVMIDRWLPSTTSCSVASDNVMGAEQVTAHLLKLGHRRIGVVKGGGDCSSTRERLAGYKKALAAGGVDYDPQLVQSHAYNIGQDHYIDGEDVLRSLLAKSGPPTALFVLHDVLAIGVLSAAIKLGLRVPRDLSIVGYDDLEVVKYLPIPLTTVAQDKLEMGRVAAELILQTLDDPQGEKRDVRLLPKLIVRQSTGKPRTKELAL